jgi:hypothetical protein
MKRVSRSLSRRDQLLLHRHGWAHNLDAWRSADGRFEWFGLFLFLRTLESLSAALLKWAESGSPSFDASVAT